MPWTRALIAGIVALASFLLLLRLGIALGETFAGSAVTP